MNPQPHRITRLLLVALLASSPLLALTATDAPDADLMQALEDLNKDLASNLGLEDRKAADANAAELQRLLLQVQAFYRARGNAADAVEISREAVELTQRVRQHLGSGALGAAAETATDLSRNCKRCHDLYKKER